MRVGRVTVRPFTRLVTTRYSRTSSERVPDGATSRTTRPPRTSVRSATDRAAVSSRTAGLVAVAPATPPLGLGCGAAGAGTDGVGGAALPPAAGVGGVAVPELAGGVVPPASDPAAGAESTTVTLSVAASLAAPKGATAITLTPTVWPGSPLPALDRSSVGPVSPSSAWPSTVQR